VEKNENKISTRYALVTFIAVCAWGEGNGAIPFPDDLTTKDHLGYSIDIMVCSAINKNLRFIFQSPKTATMQNAIAIALKTGTNRMVGLLTAAT
jgi:hypothetical protein